MNVISGLRNSGFLAQSAYSADVATNDDLGRKISTTYLTAVDLSPYATETLVEETSGAITSLIPTDYYPNTNPSGFISGVDLTPYQTTAGMTAYQPAGSYATTNELEQVSGDITATIPSTAGLASESYVQTNSAVLTGMIDGKQDTLTFGYDEQDRINSINSSALAGGGDVPEGVMVESGLEYNAVNEISAYNGSAIAQYGAEKQWLVHDDTLVHAANSAQYALGVNLSALQRLMGIDETVLFSGTGTSGAFSEPLSAFKKVEFHLSDDTMIRQVAILYPDEAPNGSYIVGAASVWQPNTAPVRVLSVSGNMNEFSRVNAAYQWWSKADGGFAQFSTSPVKVIGIGRKEV